MSNVAVIDQQRPRENRIQVSDPVPVLDTGRFEQMVRVAKLMASSNLIPETLCSIMEGEGENRKQVWLPVETVTANCFLIVNQAVGWGMDPFAVAQCASVVYGKVCYEGKLIAAVIEQKLGVRLDYEWDNKPGDELGIVVSGLLDGKVREVKGTVRDWKTTGRNSPWGKQPRTQLAYRGARDWARLHAPAVMLGVYSADEMDAAVDRQERMPTRPMLVNNDPSPPPPRSAAPAPSPRLPPPPPPPPAATAPMATTPKTPPPPPAPAQPQRTVFDFEGLRAELRAAQTEDAANDVFDRLVTQRSRHMTDDELTECDNIMREACRAFVPTPD